MNSKQQQAFDIAIAGHNLVIIGPAGTGKSFLLRQIKESLSSSGKSVKLCCSTGIACSIFQEATTIHSFLGLCDGRFDPDRINTIHNENAIYNFVDKHLNSTDCLIIDECSMISKRTFESIANICSRRKYPIQIIVCGDFLQLPPVPNHLYMDQGQYCFEAEAFLGIFPHKIVLNEICRTTEPLLVQTISDVFMGNLSAESENFIVSLSRPLSPNSEDIKLFSNNVLVDDYNRSCLLKFPGDIHEFVSTDSGEKSVLDKMVVPHTLWLKVDCPVILLQNLHDKKLVNGLRGRIQCITKDNLVVNFDTVKISTTIPLVKFTVFDPSKNTDIAVREQYPLKLAFGITIHKAQGMTLDRVQIDCRGIFKPGQLGVALSRAKTSTGIRVINFHKRYVIKPPRHVVDFIESPSTDVEIDGSCCRFMKSGGETFNKDSAEQCCEQEDSAPAVDISSSIEIATQPTETDEPFDEDDDFDEVIKAIATSEEHLDEIQVPDELMVEIQESIVTKNEVTASHRKMNEIVARINQSQLIMFAKKIMLKMKDFVKLVADSDGPITKGIPEKNMNDFQRHVHMYSISPEYRLNCMLLFDQEESLCDEHFITCYKVLESIKLFALKQKVELIQATVSKVPQRFVTDTSKARIRYVAGYCVAKLRKKYQSHQKSNMFSKTKEGQASYQDSKSMCCLLNLLKEDEQFLKESSSQPDSLVETEQKQGLKHGLTNVTDSFYMFFLALTNEFLGLLGNENFLKYGKDLFAHCSQKINNNTKLTEMFLTLVKNRMSEEKLQQFDETDYKETVLCMSNVNTIYRELTDKYLSVLLAQFRRDIKSSMKIEKKMAHRKQIKVSSSKTQSQEVSSKRKVTDSTQKHSKFKKSSDLEVHPSTSSEETYHLESQSPAVCNNIDDAGSVSQPLSKPDNVDIDDTEKCKKCLSDTNDQWIQCDSCDSWFHRKCAGLKSIKLWKKCSKPNAQWFCSQCK